MNYRSAMNMGHEGRLVAKLDKSRSRQNDIKLFLAGLTALLAVEVGAVTYELVNNSDSDTAFVIEAGVAAVAGGCLVINALELNNEARRATALEVVLEQHRLARQE